MENLHKIYVSNNDLPRVIRSCYNEEFNSMPFAQYDLSVQNAVDFNVNATCFKVENDNGALVGYFSIQNGSVKDTYIRKTFRISSYLSAINQLKNEEILLQTGASLSFSRNKILN